MLREWSMDEIWGVDLRETPRAPFEDFSGKKLL